MNLSRKSSSEKTSITEPDQNIVFCPLCRANSSISWEKSGFAFYQCVQCRHLFWHTEIHDVNQKYGDDYFSGGQGGYVDYLAQANSLRKSARRYCRLLNRFCQPGRILDVGCAAGFVLSEFVQQGWTGQGIEPNQRMARFAEIEIGLNVFNGGIEDFPDDNSPFDAAILLQVISHLTDPISCLNKVRELLMQDGLLLIETWKRDSLTARCFGRNWHQFNPPSVLHWFTLRQLKQLVEQSGFEIVRIGRPIKWIRFGYGRSLIEHSCRDSRIKTVLTSPLKIIPGQWSVPYFLDDAVWILARKSPN